MTIVMMLVSYGSFITPQTQMGGTVALESCTEEVLDEPQEVDLAQLAQMAHNTISPYDPIFKEVCEEYGNDWRLMSAMAYHESRFQPDVTSRHGAQGMMQIMPSVAKFFNVAREDLTNVETNIMVANLLVNRIDKMLRLSDAIPTQDRMSLILASYNGGVGYVLNARKLARRDGRSANSWRVVSEYLQQMKSEEYASANGVKHFVGVSQTIAYVDNVIGHYDLYCQMAAL